jgi:hypothetical protein
MKIIKSENFKKHSNDYNTFPPVFKEKDGITREKDKKKKKIYQLNKEVDDVTIDEIRGS